MIKINIGCNEKTHVARFLNFLLSAEKVAHRCAKEQASLCADKEMKKFFILQARQEKFHAVTFQAAILRLAPKGVNHSAQDEMQQYESILMNAIKNNDLLSSIIGLQIVLEGMGGVVLSHFDYGISQRGVGYKKIRDAIMTQEDAHYEFGLNYFKDNKNCQHIKHHSDNYLSIIHDIFFTLEDLFDFFDEDSSLYLTEFHQKLPAWMQSNDLSYYSNA